MEEVMLEPEKAIQQEDTCPGKEGVAGMGA